MILKKPYAFLIKYFRVIHIFLAFPILYLIIKTGRLVRFFGDYVDSNYFTSITNIAGTYINYIMYFCVLLILFIAIFIYFLMRKKEKSTRFYFLLMVFYIILFVVIGLTHSILSNMEMTTIEAATARAYRDMSYLFYLPQFLFAAFTIFRGIGFDFKKFNFEMDIKELEITDIDSEEFELNFVGDNYKIKRTLRRFIREFKYYVQENKFIFGILCSIVVITIGTLAYLNFGVYNKIYRESQTVKHNNFNVKVTGSILTNTDYGGRVFKDNKYYLVLRVLIENKNKTSATFDYNNFFIEFENRRAYPILDKAEYFIDYALPIKQDTKLEPDSKNSYVLTYEVSSEELNEEYTLKILEQTNISAVEITPQYKAVSLKPYQALKIKDIETFKLGKIATFEESSIGYTSLQLTEYQVSDSYSYTYQHCFENGSCNTVTNKENVPNSNQTLLILKGTYRLDKTTLYYKAAKTDKRLIEHFASIRYTIDGSVKTTTVENKTGNNYTEGFILQVSSDIKRAEKIDLLITIRDKRYILNIK